MLRDEEWRKEDSLMLKEGKVYVPKDEALSVMNRLSCTKFFSIFLFF